MLLKYVKFKVFEPNFDIYLRILKFYFELGLNVWSTYRAAGERADLSWEGDAEIKILILSKKQCDLFSKENYKIWIDQ